MKPIRLAVGSVLVAFVALGAGSSLLGQEGALRYRWTKGDVLRYRVVQTTNAAMSGIPGMGEMNVTNTMTQVQQFTTTDVRPMARQTRSAPLVAPSLFERRAHAGGLVAGEQRLDLAIHFFLSRILVSLRQPLHRGFEYGEGPSPIWFFVGC